jgi:hypothetical protein
MRGISYGCLAIRWRYWGKSRQTRLGNYWPPVLISYLLICSLWVKVTPAAHNIRNVVAYLSRSACRRRMKLVWIHKVSITDLMNWNRRSGYLHTL